MTPYLRELSGNKWETRQNGSSDGLLWKMEADETAPSSLLMGQTGVRGPNTPSAWFLWIWPSSQLVQKVDGLPGWSESIKRGGVKWKQQMQRQFDFSILNEAENITTNGPLLNMLSPCMVEQTNVKNIGSLFSPSASFSYLWVGAWSDAVQNQQAWWEQCPGVICEVEIPHLCLDHHIEKVPLTPATQ